MLPLITEFDLPDAELVLYDSFFTQQESDALYRNLKEKIEWQQDQIKIYGKQHRVPRLAAWCDLKHRPFAYSGISMRSHSWISELSFIKEKVEAEVDYQFTSVLLNFYRDGKDSVGWHSDDEKELGKNPVLASVSFGETRPFQLRHSCRKELDKVDIPLSHGSFLLMKGTTQHFWKHQIPKTSRSIAPRINLTFRILK
ncbi:MAG: alpha-ketoglutarate-dependent dioxygenase AlkB [SAR324 cluster bacterium]|nr:alpha-ketoglutarate-dependent dioxygenase AlkB [SAR324 cluster bacterium]